MCIREYIVYQCAHRSPPVLVTCPLTTEGHVNPVCDKRPDRAYYAETCCTACERCVHSRWVIIRENEHRWLHEHGACGCEVVFQGLLNTPRAIGADGVESEENDEKDGAPLAITDGSVGSRSSDPGVDAVKPAISKKSKGKEREVISTGADTPQGSSAPPLYRESITEDGAAHVQLRLKSLYAGEWRADHRILHETGKCNCRIVFGPFNPQISDEELTAEDWKLIQWWRDQEDAVEGQKTVARPRLGSSTSEAEVIAQRIKEIEKVFGSFEVKPKEEGMSYLNKRAVKPSHGSVAIPQPTTTFAESSEQGYRRMGRRRGQHKSQSFFNRRNSQGEDLGRDRSQKSLLLREPGFSQDQTQYTIAQYASMAPSSTPATQQGWAYDPYSNQYVQTGNVAPQSTSYYPTASSSSYQQPQGYQASYQASYPPQLQQLPQVANPAFATIATYTNTIPEGAYPWLQPHSQSRTRSKAGGPYHVVGMDYSSFDDPSHVEHVGTPICGIPIGGGAHMPPWKDCVQRQPRPAPPRELPTIVITVVEANPVGTIEYDYDQTLDSKSDMAYGAADGSAVDDNDDRNLLEVEVPRVPQRRHSAGAVL
ncbi:uncharacterized protein PODANS_1_8630 [Podospora anserina S mat+]|uniref:Podospora anserina S mat+ genomic DNA chromosome 1, supercontig 1 n=1 Tax=Podospora anserina (strain S / ATCC MYA-4624 / DSM 980 / FGSC 10383) TaxID=515849 RepID=B2A973_PODAN|nr:uncharacterized protein PODANS_1_8630 [Podospora anserina S mat+]CAP60574.1 unnamed protein product [Podospora anserina S mat+]CDP23217.1 Putative protein of unknown function [Podospora anserina S mat+]